MHTSIKSLFSRFRGDERGVTLVEYGIALVLAVVVGTTALGQLGTDVNTQLGQASTAMVE